MEGGSSGVVGFGTSSTIDISCLGLLPVSDPSSFEEGIFFRWVGVLTVFVISALVLDRCTFRLYECTQAAVVPPPTLASSCTSPVGFTSSSSTGEFQSSALCRDSFCAAAYAQAILGHI